MGVTGSLPFQERVSSCRRSIPGAVMSRGWLRTSFSRFLSASRHSNFIFSSRSSLRASCFSCGMTKVVVTPFAPARPVAAGAVNDVGIRAEPLEFLRDAVGAMFGAREDEEGSLLLFQHLVEQA